ncbi:hypothetical protein KIH74_24985 [Kineosporia sp. J2-2]|uniref:Uncharacterized protein n=1 Tax=Kineosporia corallincola TaxID=2835133 RepID=A0ABS5TQT6_9ACTN|nr:hypothetical protein [Kineosporia corallincola]MBT0772224.1 hypothetical protein [Kineosporia corallincola]
MSRTEEISTDVKAVSTAVDEARTRAEETLEYARGQIELSYEHGWDGVAQSISMAGEALEKISAEFDSAQTGFENATSTLDEINEQMSTTEVAEHLTLALSELEATQNVLEAAVALVDEAVQGAEQADHNALTSRLSGLREDIESLFERLARSRTDTEGEHEQAENMGEEKRQEDDSKNREQDKDENTDNDGKKRENGSSPGN